MAPVLSGVADRTIELTGPLTTLTPALLGISAADACDPAPTVTLSPSAVPLGHSPVTVVARDATDNTATQSCVVTVEDTTAPAFTVVPQDAERPCETGGALVSFEVHAADLSGNVSITCVDETGRAVDPAGTRFDVGTHTVTCTATDSSGNSAAASFRVTVFDDDAPVIVCPADITVGNEPGTCFAYVPFTVTATDECDPAVAIACEAPWGPVASGNAFPMGTTLVVCTARDRAGNLATRSFNVTVQDREAPQLLGPASRQLETDCAGTPLPITAALLGVTATDNCDPDVTITVAPPAAGPGTAAVLAAVADDDGNEGRKTVTVTVLRGPFEVRFQQPLDANVDNLVRPGQTVPVKVRVSCDNVVESGVAAVIDRVEQIDGAGTPIANEVVEDSGAANDDGAAMRPADGFHIYNLSTKNWPTASGARFRVVIRVTLAGHVDTFASVVLKNR